MKEKFYAYILYYGGTPVSGILNNWEDCKILVEGHSHVKFKKFDTMEKAKIWIQISK